MSDLFDFNDTSAVDNQSQSLSNKLRPERMKDLIGQDHITSKAGPLNNIIKNNNLENSQEIIKEFTKCHFCMFETRRGLGFDKPSLEGQEGGSSSKCGSGLSFGHSGFTGTLAWADPETEIIYIYLSNRIHPDDNNTKLLDMNVRTEIMDVIFNCIDEK